ncbi:MAG: hypothetical protein EZS28_029195 [Streblomastix strix]|uniref:Uncharacterized protein n=2 Tax=Streblomastix strix TaxID=222440 RepID=A0A5J4UXX6_9EUKA|nr:MAG: hypothetical protein EZS28_029195 [Streblomastix strix]
MEVLNIWGKINQMLLIVIEMKDKELASGAMQIVREVQLIPAMKAEDVNKIQQNQYHIPAVMTIEALNLLQAMMAESFTITHQVFSEQNLMENIMDIAKIKKISLMSLKDKLLVQNRFALVLCAISKHKSPVVIKWMVQKHKYIEYSSYMMSSAGGSGSDDDDILTYNMSVVSLVIMNLVRSRDAKNGKQTLDDVKNIIEYEGIQEENDTLLFHTDQRREIGVQDCAVHLKKYYEDYKEAQLNEGAIQWGEQESESDEDNSDDHSDEDHNDFDSDEEVGFDSDDDEGFGW